MDEYQEFLRAHVAPARRGGEPVGQPVARVIRSAALVLTIGLASACAGTPDPVDPGDAAVVSRDNPCATVARDENDRRSERRDRSGGPGRRPSSY